MAREAIKLKTSPLVCTSSSRNVFDSCKRSNATPQRPAAVLLTRAGNGLLHRVGWSRKSVCRGARYHLTKAPGCSRRLNASCLMTLGSVPETTRAISFYSQPFFDSAYWANVGNLAWSLNGSLQPTEFARTEHAFAQILRAGAVVEHESQKSE